MNLRDSISYLFSRLILLPADLDFIVNTQINNDSYIIVANHSSLIDGFIITSIFKRRLVVVVDAALYKYWSFNFISPFFDFIPFNKNNSLSVIRQCLNKLKENKSILIFPEGKINVDKKDLEWKNGAIYLAKKTMKKLIPISIINADSVWNANASLPTRGRIKVIIHPEIYSCKVDETSTIKRIVNDAIQIT